MKKLLFTLLSLGFVTFASAQKYLPEIKAGTVLNASVFVQNQPYPLELTIKSITAPITLAWAVESYGDGAFEMSQKALESGSSIYMDRPAMGTTTKLAETETYGLISKAAYKALIDNKTFTYNNIKFKLKPQATPMKMADKELDATHVISEDGKLELWILNNPALPLIVQSAGLPLDFLVNSFK